eukprot:gene20797-27631_t
MACAPTSRSLANLWRSQNWKRDLGPDEVDEALQKGDDVATTELLSKRLEFGTAGLGGRMGAGYNRMNHVVIQQTAQGLCSYLQAQVSIDVLSQEGIVVGYDGRHGSYEFACITAAVFASQGIVVHLFSTVVPTPYVAAAVAILGTKAGVMVTASHNPKEYNGYKVYYGNGCQIIPPQDEGIDSAILDNLELWSGTGAERAATGDPYSDIAGRLPGNERLAQAFNAADGAPSDSRSIQGIVRDPSQEVTTESSGENASAQPVVYTPLHGVGAIPVKEAFRRFGLPAPHIVAEQEHPDPEFPTVVFPNPEEGAGTWALSFRDGDRFNARLLLANDPDADRLAVAESNTQIPGGWQTFSGNEIGILLASWVEAGKCAVLASTVSSKMLSKLAEVEGLHFEETLTGFKWLGNRSIELEKEGYQVLFAFEEAIGFMFGDMFKDKDGVAAAAVFAEMAAHLYSSGSSVQQQLQELYKKDLGGLPILSIRDMGTGLDSGEPSGKTSMPWREGDMMITFRLAHGAILTLRASGTEPKLKYYLECSGEDKAGVEMMADKLEAAVSTELLDLARFGLQRPSQH